VCCVHWEGDRLNTHCATNEWPLLVLEQNHRLIQGCVQRELPEIVYSASGRSQQGKLRESAALDSPHFNQLPSVKMESSPFSALPTELIFRILDFMGPYDMSGFCCTCQHALSLVNKKLDTPDAHERYPLESWTS
jgi:hypothetical protein